MPVLASRNTVREENINAPMNSIKANSNQEDNQMKLKVSFLIAIMVASVAIATAQESTTGTIFGRVVDEQDALVPGATVTISSEQGSKVVVTDDRGRFTVPYLTPGRHSVRAELAGFVPVTYDDVQVRLGSRSELVFTLKVGAMTEQVTVTGVSPVVDVTSTTIGGTVSSEFLHKVPVGRQLADTLYVIPGVSSGGLTGSANPSIGGGAGLDNQYHIDGVNVSDNGFGSLGVYSRSYRSMGQGVTSEFIDEVQVKTGGYEAEFGQSTGGVVNVITKSGSNNFHGAGFGYVQSRGMEASRDNFDDWTNGRTTIVKEPKSDIGFSIGGPIIQDKAFFFGAFHPQWTTRTMRAPNDPAAFPLAALGDVDRDRRYMAYAAKVTYQVSSDHRLDVSFFGDPSNSDNGPQTESGSDLLRQDTTAFSELEFGGDQQTVRYSGIMSNNWLLEGSWARAGATFTELPSVNEWNTVDQRVTPNIRTGGVGFFENTESSNIQYQIKSTNHVGSHQVRYGFAYEDIGYDSISNFSGPTIILPNGTPTVTGVSVRIIEDPVFGSIYRAYRGQTANVRDTSQSYWSLFVQDKFEIGRNLSFNVGLRYEQQELTGTQTSFTWDNNWSPRLGVVYDPTSEGRAKIYANYGRFFAKVPNDLAARAMGADSGLTRADYFDSAMTMPIPDGVQAGGTTNHLILAGSAPADFDPDSKSSYLDEIIGGFEFEAMPELNLGIRYVWRDLGRVLEDIGTAPAVLYFTGQGLGEVSYFITNPSEASPTIGGLGAAFETPVRNYQSIEVTADKRISNNWGLFASYRWSRLHGNFEGFFRSDNGQSDPAITSLFDFPINDPSYTQIGVPQFGFSGDIRNQGEQGSGALPNNRVHQIKTYSTYSMDNGVGVGIGLVLSSGTPLTALAANPVYDNSGEIPLSFRGSGIESVNGFRERADFQYGLDIHVDYRINVGENSAITLIGDLFNTFNQQASLRYNQATDLSFQVSDPDFGRTLEYAAPFRLRFGARFEF
jgi:hypothetical protein